MNILIFEAYSAANIGSGALVENSIKLLKQNFPDADIEILAQTPSSIEALTKLPTYHEILTIPLGRSRTYQVFWLIRTGIWMLAHIIFTLLSKIGITVSEHLYTYNRNTLNALRKIKAADMLVSVGAERINDNFYKTIIFSLFMLGVVKGYKKFLVLFPQTIGPFHFSVTRRLSAIVLNWCDVVYVRDQRSFDTMKELGVTKADVIRTCDVAVVQTPAAQDEAEALLRKAGCPAGDKNIVGMSVMQWTYIKATGDSGYKEYCRSVAHAADTMIDKHDVFIAFIATNIRAQGCREDDIAAAEDIMALMRNKQQAVILREVYTPAQMKGLMGLMELCMVTRMHACIFCTGIHTPTVSINYQFKLKEYMTQMGLGDYTVDIDKVTPEILDSLIFPAWAKRAELRSILEASVAAWSNNLYSEMAKLPALYEKAKANDA